MDKNDILVLCSEKPPNATVEYLKSSNVVLVTVVVKGIVAGKGQEHSKTWTEREEDLSCCVNPNLTNKETERN